MNLKSLLNTLSILFIFFVSSCDRPGSKSEQVVLYTAVDEPPAWQVVGEFKRQTGIEVIMRTDAESTKTAGLAERLEAEKGNPQADVWWSNEPFHTINLAEHKVLAPYASPAAHQPRYTEPPAPI